MSDTRLRELERRFKETGSPDDEAAYLLERVRVGDLTQERLELAAYCGHEGARRATGSTHDSSVPTKGLMLWVAEAPWIRDDVRDEFCLRAARSAIRASWNDWRRRTSDGGHSAQQTVAAIEAWLEKGGPAPLRHFDAYTVVDSAVNFGGEVAIRSAVQFDIIAWLLGRGPAGSTGRAGLAE